MHESACMRALTHVRPQMASPSLQLHLKPSSCRGTNASASWGALHKNHATGSFDDRRSLLLLSLLLSQGALSLHSLIHSFSNSSPHTHTPALTSDSHDGHDRPALSLGPMALPQPRLQHGHLRSPPPPRRSPQRQRRERMGGRTERRRRRGVRRAPWRLVARRAARVRQHREKQRSLCTREPARRSFELLRRQAHGATARGRVRSLTIDLCKQEPFVYHSMSST